MGRVPINEPRAPTGQRFSGGGLGAARGLPTPDVHILVISECCAFTAQCLKKSDCYFICITLYLEYFKEDESIQVHWVKCSGLQEIRHWEAEL